MFRAVSILVVLVTVPWLAASVHADAERAVLLLVDQGREAELAEALRLELAGGGFDVRTHGAPAGETPLLRAAQAQQRARHEGAAFAVWIEPNHPAAFPAGSLRVISADGADVRQVPLSEAIEGIHPRVFAVLASSLFDDMPEPPRIVVARGEPPTEQPTAEGEGSTSTDRAEAGTTRRRRERRPNGYAALEIRSPNVFGVLRLNGRIVKGWTPRQVNRVPAGRNVIEIVVDGTVRRRRVVRLSPEERRRLVLW